MRAADFRREKKTHSKLQMDIYCLTFTCVTYLTRTIPVNTLAPIPALIQAFLAKEREITFAQISSENDIATKTKKLRESSTFILSIGSGYRYKIFIKVAAPNIIKDEINIYKYKNLSGVKYKARNEIKSNESQTENNIQNSLFLILF